MTRLFSIYPIYTTNPHPTAPKTKPTPKHRPRDDVRAQLLEAAAIAASQYAATHFPLLALRCHERILALQSGLPPPPFYLAAAAQAEKQQMGALLPLLPPTELGAGGANGAMMVGPDFAGMAQVRVRFVFVLVLFVFGGCIICYNMCVLG